MKIGLSVSTFPTKFGPIVYSAGSLEELDLVFGKVKQFGYDGVDLFIDPTTKAKAREIKALLDKHRLEVAMLICIYLVDLGVNLASLDEDKRKRSVEIYIEQFNIAQILGAKTMPIGFIRGRLETVDNIAAYGNRLAQSLNELVPEAKKHDVVLCIEPINRYEVNTLLSVPEVVDFITSYHLQNIKILPDLFHMNIEDADFSKSLLEADQLIGHMHVPDSNRKAPGWGHTNYESVLRDLKKINYQGYLSIEAMPFGEADKSAMQGLTYLKTLLNKIEGKDQ